MKPILKNCSDLQEQFQKSIKLAHSHLVLCLCAYIDAIKAYWAAAATQCKKVETNKLVANQKHSSLIFLCLSFSATQDQPLKYEKEAYYMVQTPKQAKYILACAENITIFSVHRNLLIAFHSTVVELSLGRHKVFIVICCTLHLSAFSIQSNMPGWTKQIGRYNHTLEAHLLSNSKSSKSCGLPSNFPWCQNWFLLLQLKKSKWTSQKFILNVQNYMAKKPTDVPIEIHDLIRMWDKVWMLPHADEIIINIFTDANASRAGHRGYDATDATLWEKFAYSGLYNDAKEFVFNRLLCIMSRSGTRVLRPLKTTVHAKLHDEAPDFDYLYLGDSSVKIKYAIVLKYYFSGYARLSATIYETSEHKALALVRWKLTFTAFQYWISDQRSHLIRELLQNMLEMHNIRDKSTVAYSPRVNGTIGWLKCDVQQHYGPC